MRFMVIVKSTSEAGVLLAMDGLHPSEYVRRSPNSHWGESEIEIRQVFEMEDFAPVLSEEQIQRPHPRLRPSRRSRAGSTDLIAER